MVQYLKKNLKLIQLLAILLPVLSASPCISWTTAQLFNVTVTVDLAAEGPSTVTTDARFVVEAGYFHGFDFADLPGATLDEIKAIAFQDDQREYKVEFKRTKSGKIRALLADDEYVRGGGITFRIIHQIDFVKNGNLRVDGGRALFDWTPLTWDVGQDNMRIQIRLPESTPSDIRVDPTVAEDYVSTVSANQADFIKFRPVKWYAMRVAMEVNAAAFPALALMTAPIDTAPRAAAKISEPKVSPGFLPAKHIAMLVAVCLLMWLAWIQKTRFIQNVFLTFGKRLEFHLLKKTAFAGRASLALFAILGAGLVQALGHVAASVPLLIAASSLFLVQKEQPAKKPRGGGVWCEMNDKEIAWYLELYKAYNRSRRSMVDISTLQGQLTFAMVVTLLFCAAFFTDLRNSDAAFVLILDGLLLSIPAWFACISPELPRDAAMESFGLLRKWKKSLNRLIGEKASFGQARLFVRKDEDGPIEVRLRAELPLEGVLSVDVGAETVNVGSLSRVRAAFLFRTRPGAPVARKLAVSAYAVEHHLSPDLSEEIIVLRNRRGQIASGLMPLRAAIRAAAN